MSEIILNEFQTEIEKLVEASSGPGKNCGRNAIYHLRKAWEIKDIDREMATFRGLTAEEEAANAIINELREKQYKGASKIETNHVHAMALKPFLQAVEIFLAKTIPADQTHQLVFVPHEGETRLQFRFRINHKDHPELQDLWINPIPPLHGLITMEGVPYDFESEIQALVTTTMTSSVKRHVKDRAQQRNALLYARPQGIPQMIGNVAKFLQEQQKTVFKYLGIFLMIYPYEQKQHLVQQTLQAFLKMLGFLEGDIQLEE